MSRLALFILACALLASITFTFASPVPFSDGELVNILEKRISHTGRGTWYAPGLGNCGWTNSASDNIIAISKGLYDRNGGSNCGQGVYITCPSSGRSAYATVADSCQSCGDNDIDMSPAVFQQLDPLSVGVLTVTWNFQGK